MKTCKKILILCFVFAATLLLFADKTNAMSLNQTSVSLSQGQTSTIYAYYVSGFLYVSSNSNSNVATVSINANNINIYGNTAGNTTATICDNNTSSCASLYITVTGGYGGSSNLSLSQTNVSLSIGQTSTITSYNYYSGLYISNNSNQGVATASVSGNTISIYGSSAGNTTLTICQSSNINYCGTVYVTVSGYYGGTSNIGLNISNLTLPLGSSATLSSSNYNYSTTYYYGNYQTLNVTSNSNPNIASASYSSLPAGCTGNANYSITTGQPCYLQTSNPGTIIIQALSVGSTTIVLCQNNANTCSTLYVTVTGYNNVIGYNPIYTGTGKIGRASCRERVYVLV